MKLTTLKNRFLKDKILLSEFFILCFLFITPCLSFAQNSSLIFAQPNTYGIGPRAIGMGGAFTAIADDASAAYWNPAGLSQISSYEISISSAPVYFQNDVNPNASSNTGFPNSFGFPWVASFQLVIPIAKDNTLALSYFRPYHPQINYYSGNPVLTAEQEADASYLQNPTFQESELVLSYAARFAGVNNFSVGISVKRVTNDSSYIEYFPQDDPSIASELNGTGIGVVGYGVDLGVLYRIPITKYSEEFRIGLSLQNLVSQVQYTNGLIVIPTISGEPVNFNVGPGFQTPI